MQIYIEKRGALQSVPLSLWQVCDNKVHWPKTLLDQSYNEPKYGD